MSNISSAVMDNMFSARSPEITAVVEPLPSVRSIWKVHLQAKKSIIFDLTDIF